MIKMVVGLHRNAHVNVDLVAIKHNIAVELARMDEQQELFAVVKANAYGHGIVPVAKAARQAGATGFCVALIDEGLALREAGIAETILILGVTPAREATLMAKYDLSTAVGDLEFLIQAQKKLAQAGAKLKVHLALDTGMGRIGFRDQAKLSQAIDFLHEHTAQFEFEGIFTHFATADAKDQEHYNYQVKKFNELMKVVTTRPRYVHVANSAAAMWHTDCGGNVVRYGITMYGLNPSGAELKLPETFKPALSLESELVAVKQLQPGDGVGYGKTYTASKPEWLGTVPLGYADGWLRRMQGYHVLVAGQPCEIVGRVCMDQFMVRLPHKLPLGTKVTLIGQDGEQKITAQDAAEYAQTINYEIVCALSERLPRYYK